MGICHGTIITLRMSRLGVGKQTNLGILKMYVAPATLRYDNAECNNNENSVIAIVILIGDPQTLELFTQFCN